MSREFIALVGTRPEIPLVLEHIELPRILQLETRPGATHLNDENGRILIVIREPFLVHVPGETERLLNTAAQTPVWWLEIQAAASSPLATRIAERCASTTAELYNGTFWKDTPVDVTVAPE